MLFFFFFQFVFPSLLRVFVPIDLGQAPICVQYIVYLASSAVRYIYANSLSYERYKNMTRGGNEKERSSITS